MKKVNKLVWARDKATCQDCGKKLTPGKREGHVHHFSGDFCENEEDNLVLLCRYCHFCRHYFPDERYGAIWFGSEKAGVQVGREFKHLPFARYYADCVERYNKEHEITQTDD